MSHFDRAQLVPYFEKWDEVKPLIEQYYGEKDRRVLPLMKEAIENYSTLLSLGGKEGNSVGKQVYVLQALNGEERFEFIQARIDSHYACIQLDALYTETKKKAARLAVRQK